MGEKEISGFVISDGGGKFLAADHLWWSHWQYRSSEYQKGFVHQGTLQEIVARIEEVERVGTYIVILSSIKTFIPATYSEKQGLLIETERVVKFDMCEANVNQEAVKISVSLVVDTGSSIPKRGLFISQLPDAIEKLFGKINIRLYCFWPKNEPEREPADKHKCTCGDCREYLREKGIKSTGEILEDYR